MPRKRGPAPDETAHMYPSDPWAHTAPLPEEPYPRYPRTRYPEPGRYQRVDPYPYAGRYDEDLTARYDEDLVAPPNGRRTRPLAMAGMISAIVISIGLVVVLVSFVLPGGSKPTAAPQLPGLLEEPPAATLAPQPTPDAPTPTDTPTAGPSPSADPTGDRAAIGNTAVENAVVAFVNSVRRQVRCEPVENDPRLRQAARLHSADMAAGGFLSHTGSDGSSAGDRMRAAGYDAPLSENLARGFGSAREVVQGWLGSREQRRNILDCDARAVGVGVAVGADGRPYWTEDFGR